MATFSQGPYFCHLGKIWDAYNEIVHQLEFFHIWKPGIWLLQKSKQSLKKSNTASKVDFFYYYFSDSRLPNCVQYRKYVGRSFGIFPHKKISINNTGRPNGKLNKNINFGIQDCGKKHPWVAHIIHWPKEHSWKPPNTKVLFPCFQFQISLFMYSALFTAEFFRWIQIKTKIFVKWIFFSFSRIHARKMFRNLALTCLFYCFIVLADKFYIDT